MKKIKKFLTSSLLALSLVSKTYKNPIYNLNKNINSQNEKDFSYCIQDEKTKNKCLEDDLFFLTEYTLRVFSKKTLTLEKIDYLNKDFKVIYTINAKEYKIQSSLKSIFQSKSLDTNIYNPLIDFDPTHDNSAYHMVFYLKDDENNTKIININFKDRNKNFLVFLTENYINNSGKYPYLYPFKDKSIKIKLYRRFFDKTILSFYNGRFKNNNEIAIGINEPVYIDDTIYDRSKFTFKHIPLYKNLSILYKKISIKDNDKIIASSNYLFFPSKVRDFEYLKIFEHNKIPIKKITKNADLQPGKDYYLTLDTYFGITQVSPQVQIKTKFEIPDYEKQIEISLNKKDIKTVVKNINNEEKTFYTFNFYFKIKNNSKYNIGQNLYETPEGIKKDFYVKLNLNCTDNPEKEIIIPIRKIIPIKTSTKFTLTVTTNYKYKDKVNLNSLDKPLFYFSNEGYTNCSINSFNIYEDNRSIAVATKSY